MEWGRVEWGGVGRMGWGGAEWGGVGQSGVEWACGSRVMR